MPDSIAELAALIGEGGDSGFRLSNLLLEIGNGVETVVFEKPVVGVKLCHIL